MKLSVVFSVVFTLLFTGSVVAAELHADVHRDEFCGCCKDWIVHLEENGFTVNDQVESNMNSIKEKLGIAPALRSCHTAVINGKFFEGHVPADAVKKVLADDDLIGAAVPGMPVGSPGMEMGDRQDKYDVVGITRDGKTKVVASYP